MDLRKEISRSHKGTKFTKNERKIEALWVLLGEGEVDASGQSFNLTTTFPYCFTWCTLCLRVILLFARLSNPNLFQTTS
jgi:hypothetical protein